MLDKNRLKKAIQAAFDAESDKDIKPSEARERMAEGIAEAIITEVESATITVSGITTTGTATAQTQAAPVEAKVT